MFPIPANATRIRYLESTGTQYVDTGIIPTLSDAVSVDADMVLTTIKTNDNNILFGSYYDNNVAGTSTVFNARLFAFVDSSRKARIAYGGAASGTVAVSTGERLAVSAQFAAGNSRLLVNGVQSSATSSSPTILPNIAIWIFRAAYGIPTVTVSPCSARLYSLTITVNGTLVRSFVPVRVGQVGYLFDRVSGQLYGNAGTGDFVLGPDTFAQGVVPTRMMAMGVRRKPYDAEVEYIESTGTQYIDTGVIVSSIGHVSVDLEFTTNVSNQGILGSEARSGSSNAQKERFYGLVSTSEGAVSGGYIDFGNMTNSRLFATSAATGMRLVVDHDVNVPSSTKTDGATIYIFAVSNQNGTGPTGSKAQFKLRYLRVLDKSSVLIRDFIPVRIGQTGALFDRVSGQLFGNAGTGSFVLGPDTFASGVVPTRMMVAGVRKRPYDAEVKGERTD